MKPLMMIKLEPHKLVKETEKKIIDASLQNNNTLHWGTYQKVERDFDQCL